VFLFFNKNYPHVEHELDEHEPLEQAPQPPISPIDPAKVRLILPIEDEGVKSACAGEILIILFERRVSFCVLCEIPPKKTQTKSAARPNGRTMYFSKRVFSIEILL
jgi:hypothetical protein